MLGLQPCRGFSSDVNKTLVLNVLLDDKELLPHDECSERSTLVERSIGYWVPGPLPRKMSSIAMLEKLVSIIGNPENLGYMDGREW